MFRDFRGVRESAAGRRMLFIDGMLVLDQDCFPFRCAVSSKFIGGMCGRSSASKKVENYGVIIRATIDEILDKGKRLRSFKYSLSKKFLDLVCARSVK